MPISTEGIDDNSAWHTTVGVHGFVLNTERIATECEERTTTERSTAWQAGCGVLGRVDGCVDLAALQIFCWTLRAGWCNMLITSACVNST